MDSLFSFGFWFLLVLFPCFCHLPAERVDLEFGKEKRETSLYLRERERERELRVKSMEQK